MAATAKSQKFGTRANVKSYEVTATGPADVAWVDMSNFETFFASVVKTVGTNVISNFSIIANAQSDGSGTDVTVIDGTVDIVNVNAVGENGHVECTADMVKEAGVAAGEDVRYVSINLTQTATEECVVTYILADPKFGYSDLTANL
ncbi:MAG: hypothetical protein ACE5FM_02955 [Methyloligellaceae bacterium]